MKYHLGKCIEVYITNECNLTCSNCNRYNNYNFTGHYSPSISQDAVKEWSKRITADKITIIGGEPTLHPEIEQWIDLLCTSWPDIPVMIQTNGTIWKQDRIFSTAKKYKNLGFGVAIHTDSLTNQLQHKFGCHPDSIHFDPNSIPIFDATEFTECALVDNDTHFTTHTNVDSESSFKCCSMSHSHTLLNGKLYRCPMPAVLPEFRQQYDVRLTEEQHELLYSYKSLSHNCSDHDLAEFVASRDTPLPQCKLCPGQYILSTVTFDIKRKKRPKLNQ